VDGETVFVLALHKPSESLRGRIEVVSRALDVQPSGRFKGRLSGNVLGNRPGQRIENPRRDRQFD
jgi:hypothetical protein